MNATFFARLARRIVRGPGPLLRRMRGLARHVKRPLVAVVAVAVAAAVPLATGMVSVDAAPRGEVFGGQVAVTVMCTSGYHQQPTQAIVSLRPGDVVQGTIEVVQGQADPDAGYAALVRYADLWPDDLAFGWLTIDGSKLPFSFTAPSSPAKGKLNGCVQAQGMVALVTYTVFRPYRPAPTLSGPVYTIAAGEDPTAPGALDTESYRLLVNGWYGLFRGA
jgi:hypothetical protein